MSAPTFKAAIEGPYGALLAELKAARDVIQVAREFREGVGDRGESAIYGDMYELEEALKTYDVCRSRLETT